ncbi:unnamed protein product [Effrenium voratum]|uniref:Uncharacterized protein n=1 Tax=Effrenium voratum TaxID=2562239 RepID=A0AA36NGY1_9DINO|nr:unnamed protein product [Effrenium voratum]
MEASASSSAQASFVGTYVHVSFDDGPATGITAQVSEDDLCDPRYWRFEEVHGGVPTFKVLFPDGLVSFIRELPCAKDGVLVDEDGDEHRYVVMDQLPGDKDLSRGQSEMVQEKQNLGGPAVVPEAAGHGPKRKATAEETSGSKKARNEGTPDAAKSVEGGEGLPAEAQEGGDSRAEPPTGGASARVSVEKAKTPRSV